MPAEGRSRRPALVDEGSRARYRRWVTGRGIEWKQQLDDVLGHVPRSVVDFLAKCEAALGGPLRALSRPRTAAADRGRVELDVVNRSDQPGRRGHDQLNRRIDTRSMREPDR